MYTELANITLQINTNMNEWNWPHSQSVKSLTADPGVVSSILARSHTFVEIDLEIISTIFLLLQLIQEGLLSVT